MLQLNTTIIQLYCWVLLMFHLISSQIAMLRFTYPVSTFSQVCVALKRPWNISVHLAAHQPRLTVVHALGRDRRVVDAEGPRARDERLARIVTSRPASSSARRRRPANGLHSWIHLRLRPRKHTRTIGPQVLGWWGPVRRILPPLLR